MSPEELFEKIAAQHDFPANQIIKSGGQYTPLVIDGRHAYVAGQIPRVGDEIHFIGTVGADISLEDARRAAAISTLRALTLVRNTIGNLHCIASVPRVGVYVRCAPDFTQLSEVADGASAILAAVLGDIAVHTRTAVGVLQLPKGASVEIEFMFTLLPQGVVQDIGGGG